MGDVQTREVSRAFLVTLASVQHSLELVDGIGAGGAAELLEGTTVARIQPERLFIDFACALLQAAGFVDLAERNHRVDIELIDFEHFQKVRFGTTSPLRVLRERVA